MIQFLETPYKKRGKCVYFLATLEDMKEENDLLLELIDLLDLEDTADENAVLEAIRNRSKGVQTAESGTEKALRLGLVDKVQERMLLTMEKHDPKGFELYFDERRKEQEHVVTKLVDKAIEKTKIIHYEHSVYEQIRRDMGIATLHKLLTTLPTSKRPNDIIEGGKAYGGRSGWGMDEYRKFAPEELAANPELYRTLLQKEGRQDDRLTLEWYRKNDPDFLLNNPDVYQCLIEKENNINN
jgi:hypothetical protein